jgi:hypothetical protein
MGGCALVYVADKVGLREVWGVMLWRVWGFKSRYGYDGVLGLREGYGLVVRMELWGGAGSVGGGLHLRVGLFGVLWMVEC